jgi:hypothetical protein
VERAIAWLEERAVDLGVQAKNLRAEDRSDFYAEAAHLRTAAREMATAFGVAVPQ